MHQVKEAVAPGIAVPRDARSLDLHLRVGAGLHDHFFFCKLQVDKNEQEIEEKEKSRKVKLLHYSPGGTGGRIGGAIRMPPEERTFSAEGVGRTCLLGGESDAPSRGLLAAVLPLPWRRGMSYKSNANNEIFGKK